MTGEAEAATPNPASMARWSAVATRSGICPLRWTGKSASSNMLARARLLGRSLVEFLVRISGRDDVGPALPARRPIATRPERLRQVALALETLLDELDALEVQRAAIDVCMALERIKAMLEVITQQDDPCAADWPDEDLPARFIPRRSNR